MSTVIPTTGTDSVTGAFPAPFWRTHLLPVALGCALLTLCSKIHIPLEPVPISLQSVGVLLIGLLYTRTNAIQTIASYLTLGALGLPVFASYTTVGLHTLVGPTGGYLLGFLAAVTCMTFVRDKWLNKPRWSHYVALSSFGTVVIFALGVSWLAHLVGIEKAITLGVTPFILPAVVKIAILASLIKIYQTITRQS